MKGLATAVDQERRSVMLKEYLSRFRLGTILSRAISRTKMYSFRPEWIRYTDNNRRLGFRFELSLRGQ